MGHSAQEGITIAVPAATVTAAATQSMSFDRSGSDEAIIKINMGTCATTSAVFTTLKVVESDTVTSPTSMDAIVAFNGATATSISAGYVLPTSAEMENGGIANQFQIDLRKRKKYIGVILTPAQSIVVGQEARLVRNGESADSATEQSGSNLVNTNAVGMNKIVNG